MKTFNTRNFLLALYIVAIIVMSIFGIFKSINIDRQDYIVALSAVVIFGLIYLFFIVNKELAKNKNSKIVKFENKFKS